MAQGARGRRLLLSWQCGDRRLSLARHQRSCFGIWWCPCLSSGRPGQNSRPSMPHQNIKISGLPRYSSAELGTRIRVINSKTETRAEMENLHELQVVDGGLRFTSSLPLLPPSHPSINNLLLLPRLRAPGRQDCADLGASKKKESCKAAKRR